jgi:lysozyme
MTSVALAGALIRVFEGCRLASYKDSGGIWTIGFGHTAGVQPGQLITYEQALGFLQANLAPLLKLVGGVESPLAQAAYLSFGYNAGYGSLQKVLAGKAALGDFVHDHTGNVLAGLQARRGLEAALIGWENPNA